MSEHDTAPVPLLRLSIEDTDERTVSETYVIVVGRSSAAGTFSMAVARP